MLHGERKNASIAWRKKKSHPCSPDWKERMERAEETWVIWEWRGRGDCCSHVASLKKLKRKRRYQELLAGKQKESHHLPTNMKRSAVLKL